METEKRICRRCKHYRYNRGVLECGKAKHTKITYSDGELVTWYSSCDQVNSSGECSMYEYQPTFWEWLKPILSAMNIFAWPCPDDQRSRSK